MMLGFILFLLVQAVVVFWLFRRRARRNRSRDPERPLHHSVLLLLFLAQTLAVIGWPIS